MTNPELAELLDRLMDMACPIISHLAGGRDSNQQPLPGLQARIDAIPEKIHELAAWLDAHERSPEQGTWWCNAHQREATYLSWDGRRKCDPKLGGIMLPCEVVFVEAKITP
jgi:hypothetical protein